MVSQELTELEEGVVQWKPDPKDMPDTGNGPWKSYQIKVNEKYFDCAQKIYNALTVADIIKFTFSTKSFVYKAGERQGQTGYRYKIADLIGGVREQPETITPVTATPQSDVEPETAPQWPGSIGRTLVGAEFGMLYGHAIEECQRLGIMNDGTLEDVFLQFLRVSMSLKSQPMPTLDPEPVPLQDDPNYNTMGTAPEPDWSDAPDPTEPQE